MLSKKTQKKYQVFRASLKAVIRSPTIWRSVSLQTIFTYFFYIFSFAFIFYYLCFLHVFAYLIFTKLLPIRTTISSLEEKRSLRRPKKMLQGPRLSHFNDFPISICHTVIPHLKITGLNICVGISCGKWVQTAPTWLQ